MRIFTFLAFSFLLWRCVFAQMQQTTLEQMVHESNTIIIAKIVKLQDNREKRWISGSKYSWQLKRKALLEVSEILKGKSDESITLTFPEVSEHSLKLQQGEQLIIFFNRDPVTRGLSDMKKINIDQKGCVTVYDVKQLSQGVTFRSQYISLLECIDRIKKYVALEVLHDKQ